MGGEIDAGKLRRCIAGGAAAQFACIDLSAHANELAPVVSVSGMLP